MAYLPNVQFQPYIRPNVGNTNAELADTIKTLSNRYDENLQAGTALDALAGQTVAQVGAGDRDEVIKKVDLVKKQLQGIVTSESGYYGARPQISQLAASFKGDPDLAVMMSNKQLQDQEAKINNELTAKGVKVLNFNQPGFKSISYDSNGKKIYNTYTPGSEAMHNYHDAQAKYFDQIQADASSGGLSKSAMEGFLQTGTFQGISGAKIKHQADRALASYLQTPEGNQQLRNYTQLQGMTPQQASQAIQKEMIATGYERVFSQSQTNYMQDPMFQLDAKLALAASKGKKGATGSDYPLETEKQLPMTNRDNVDAAVFAMSDSKKYPFANLTQDQKDLVYNSINKAKADLGPGATNIEVKQQAAKYLHGRSDFNTAPRYFAVSGTKDINAENNTFQNGNYTARLYQDIDNPGKTMNWEQMKKKYDLGDDDSKIIKNMNVSGFYHVDNPFTQGLSGVEADRFVQPLRLTVNLPTGGTKTIVAGTDLGTTRTQQFPAAKFIHEIYLGDKTGRGKRIVDGGKTYFIHPTGKTTPVQQADGTVSYEDAFQVVDGSGKQMEVPESALIAHYLSQR